MKINVQRRVKSYQPVHQQVKHGFEITLLSLKKECEVTLVLSEYCGIDILLL